MKLAPVLAVLAALGLAACGSSSTTPTTASGGGGVASSTSSRYQARLALAKCLRSHGVNVPDPSPNGGPAGGAGGGGFRALQSDPNARTALQACAKYRTQAFGFGNLSAAQRAQFQQQLVKFAECMRTHNINIPDPTASATGGFRIFRQIAPSQRNSPAFRSALQACATNLPFRRGVGPGGPGGPPGGGAVTPGA